MAARMTAAERTRTCLWCGDTFRIRQRPTEDVPFVFCSRVCVDLALSAARERRRLRGGKPPVLLPDPSTWPPGATACYRHTDSRGNRSLRWTWDDATEGLALVVAQ